MMSSYEFDISKLFEAYYECRKGKRNKPNFLEFEINLEENLIDLYDDLKSGNWEPSSAICFSVKHPKPREIWAANFRDRIVHHLIYQAIGNYFEQDFIEDTYACIKNRGTMNAIKKAQQYINSNNGFIIKCDVSSFFNSIDKNILFQKIQQKVSNEFLINIIEKIIFQDLLKDCIIKNDISNVPAYKSLFNAEKTRGLPIGNLSSQFFANVYLNDLDHRLNEFNYIRYVDDFLVIGDNPNYYLHLIKEELEKVNLKLTDSKTIIVPTKHGIDFVGSEIKPFRRHLRTKTKNHAIKQIHENPSKERISSYIGLANSNGNRKNILTFCKIAHKNNYVIIMKNDKIPNVKLNNTK